MILRDVPRVSTPRGSSYTQKHSIQAVVKIASFTEVNSGPVDITQPPIPSKINLQRGLAMLLLYIRREALATACRQTFVDRVSTAIRVLPNFGSRVLHIQARPCSYRVQEACGKALWLRSRTILR